MIASLINAPSTRPVVHKFEDGFVERSVAIVVRNRTAYVEYSIGFNESTLRDILASWNQADANIAQTSGTGQPHRRSDFKDSTHVLPSANKDRQTAGESSDSQAPDRENTMNLESAPADSSEPVKPDVELRKADQSGPVHTIAPDILSKLKRQAPAEITNGLEINCNGNPVDVVSAQEGPVPRHPFVMTVTFQFELPEGETCDLVFDDSNFPEQDGAVRYALKAAGDSLLLRSNVAPIIVRAERVELKSLPMPQRKRQTSINARLGFAK